MAHHLFVGWTDTGTRASIVLLVGNSEVAAPVGLREYAMGQLRISTRLMLLFGMMLTFLVVVLALA